MGCMSPRAKNRNQVYGELAAKREEEALLIPIVDALPEVKRLKALQQIIAGLEAYAEATRQRTGSVIVSAQPNSEYAGLSLPEAATKHVENIGVPQSPDEIWDALRAGGVTLMAKKPAHAVHNALRKRVKKNSRLQFAGGKWSLKPLDFSKGGVADSNLEKHRQLTKDGIAHFKARTGASWGRKPYITAAQIEKFRELLDSGEYSVSAASRLAGMSNAYFYMNKEAISAWNKGDPWPPVGGLVNHSRKKDRLTRMEAPAGQLKLVVGGADD